MTVAEMIVAEMIVAGALVVALVVALLMVATVVLRRRGASGRLDPQQRSAAELQARGMVETQRHGDRSGIGSGSEVYR